MRSKENRGMMVLLFVIIILFVVFIVLYQNERIRVELPDTLSKNVTMSNWSLENSSGNGRPIEEDKSIYETDNTIYDTYISIFPTKDENGELIDFSAFGKHQARDHDYNPTLNSNIQIVEEGGVLDPLLNLDFTNSTIRVRGNSSRGDTYKSYKVKLDEETGGFLGQTSLNLNKHSEDHSKITTKFCTDVIRHIDHLVSYRTNFMRVWIRDTSLPEDEQEYEYYGLFTHIEQPNKSFLEVRGLSSNCQMYKARNFGFSVTEAMKNVDDPDYSQDEFELELGIREGESHQKLIEMLEVLNDPTSNFEDVMDTYFNEDNYVTWLAFSLLMGADDILNHNFILYSPKNIKTWYFIPWDFDSNLSPVSKRDHMPVSLRGGQKLNQVILHRRFFRVPGNLEKIQTRMKELMDNHLSEDDIKEVTQPYTDILEKTMMLEPDLSLLRFEPNELLPYIENFPTMIKENYSESLEAFEYPAPMFVSKPERTEDNKIRLSWDNSYSYQGRTITYNVIIANDYSMNNILFEERGIAKNEIYVELGLEPGTYYLKVTAEDSEGNEQLSLEHYEFAGDIFIYESGVLEFTLE